jgi:LAS superfamily LD-carboxypeptidase LdcB
MKRLLSIAASFLLIGFVGSVLAQDSNPPAGSAPSTTSASAIPNKPIKVIQWRIKNQLKRIHLGVKAKKITHAEAKDLKTQVNTIRKQLKTDIAANKKAGVKKLTDDQYNQLKQMLDDNSKAITDGKNDGETDSNASPAATAPSTTPAN